MQNLSKPAITKKGKSGEKAKRRRKTVAELKSSIRVRLRRHFSDLGFVRTIDGCLEPPGTDKDILRAMHSAQRASVLAAEKDFIANNLTELQQHFASGWEICPEEIWPRLELVEAQTWQAKLFRLASLTWSIPVSQGYGRRMRFLVWDDHNNKLIGLIALGDPVFNLKVRDDWIGWSGADRTKRLTSVMDAYVLGSVPPYSHILGGKLVASIVQSKDIQNHFAARYERSQGIISKKRKHAALTLITTTSAFGRSSLYNRLKLGPQPLFHSLGYTQGYGHFHVPEPIFDLMRDYLRRKKNSYSNNFEYGQGANWRLRVVREACTLAQLSPGFRKHGVKREVFACEIASNARAVLRGETSTADYESLLTVTEMGLLARERWMVPRALREDSYQDWSKAQLADLLRPRVNSAAILDSSVAVTANGAS